MFAPIYSNLQAATFATGTAKSTFYRWLCGVEPSLRHIASLNERLKIEIPISYLAKFIKTAKALSSTNELDKVVKTINDANLELEDMILLAEYHKNRIWKNSSNVVNAEDLCDEC